MLQWCSYCQQFMGEVPDYEDLVVTHGMCTPCSLTVHDFAESDFVHAESLRKIQGRLFDAGRRNDLIDAEKIIAEATRKDVRPVDILIGLVAPILYQIDIELRSGTLDAEGERRITAFCEDVFDMVAPMVSADPNARLPRPGENEVILMNAPGNHHTLGIRILGTWLKSRGVQARTADSNIGLAALVELVRVKRCKLVLISMALAEQRNAVVSIADGMARMRGAIRPTIFVGGYAVKLGLVAPIPGASLVSDISTLSHQF